ncbi:MAG: response regulator, partial [Planctomycetes bacterium]|nr:response regulator [Planctomycetota bacterium]
LRADPEVAMPVVAGELPPPPFWPDVTVAQGGQEAIDAVAAATAVGGFAMAFVDIHMPPGLDGFATIDRLWSIDADLQVVLVSGNAEQCGFELPLRFGATDKLLVLKKPFEAVEARQFAAALCRKRELLRESRRRQHELELHVAERTHELHAALHATRAAARARMQFLANMSHEIRTPLTAILGFAELMRAPGCSDEDRQQHLDVLDRNSSHLLQLVNDVLDLSKLEANQLIVEFAPIDLPALLDEVVATLRPLAEEKGIRVDLRYRAPCPRTLVTDGMRVRQILLNLVGNAVKFTAAGGVTLELDATIDDDGDACLALHVVDTGIGVAPERQPALFEPFVQADASTSRRFGGTGLGLSISRQLSRCLGGDVVMQSEPGQGSTFTLILPAGVRASEATFASPEAARAPAAAPRPAAAATAQLHGRILLVEDSADNRRLLSVILRRAGASVELAGNGVEALAAIDAATAVGAPFDLVLMDMQMPVMDGYTATRELRQRGWPGPVIALTAHSMEGDRERCLAEGCDGYETKPVRAERLVATCARFLARPVGD